MDTFSFRNKTYQLDNAGFLLDRRQWDEDFATGMAVKVEITDELTEKHWDVINFICKTHKEFGKCPLVYQTCRVLGIYIWELKILFPTGYLRGACRLAGCSHKDADPKFSNLKRFPEAGAPQPRDKIYTIDTDGFLVNPDDWDEQFCFMKAYEARMSMALTDKHWKIIYFLRNSYAKNNTVPTVYDACESNNIDIMELEKLFPGGYHRGAVKFAGLRIR